MKIENAIANGGNSAHRFYLRDSSSFGTETGIYVMELKVLTGSHLYFAFGPLKRQMSNYCLYNAAYPFSATGRGWTSVRFVIDAATDKALTYVNGSLITNYNENNVMSYTYDVDQFPAFINL